MEFFKSPRFQTIFILALAMLLYSNTLWHEFVLDDDVVIVRNDYVQQGLKGIPAIFSHDTFEGFSLVGEGESLLEGGRYRPMSLAFFALIYSFFGANTFVFHLFSVLMYAIASLMLLKWLRLALTTESHGGWIAFFATLLFVVHPVHTEVVANIKSADETLALLFGISSLFLLLKAVDKNSKGLLVFAGLLMMFACFSKENAIALMLIAPLSLWYFRKTKFTTTLLHSIPFIVGGLLFLLIRYFAIGDQPPGIVMHDPLNNPFLEWGGEAWLEASTSTKAATILYTLNQYLRLMIFPHPLIHGYFPFHFQLQQFTSPWVILSILILVAMIFYGLWSMRRRALPGFGILFFLITILITSNIIVQIGSFMAERFLFLPSIGLILSAVILGFRMKANEVNKVTMYAFSLIAVVFAVLTVLRNPDWKNNESLFQADIIHSPKSAKLQNELGTILLDNALKSTDTARQQALFRESLPHLEKAVELHPTYFDAYLAYGACSYYLGRYERSVLAYSAASQLFPLDPKPKTGLWYALQAYGKYEWEQGKKDEGIRALEEAWNLQTDANIATQLSQYYKELGKTEDAEKWSGRTGFVIDK